MESESEIRYSVIIPTSGRAEYLARCLEHLAAVEQPAAGWEVLVTDTSEVADQPRVRVVAEGFRRRVPGLRYIPLAAEGLMLGRHAGVSAAHGRIVAFLDDDSFVFGSWLRGIEEAFEQDGVAMAGGSNVPLHEGAPPAWLEFFWVRDAVGRMMVDLSLLEYGDQAIEVSPAMIWGCNLAIRRDVFLNVGGSHPDCIAPALQRYQGDGESALATRVSAAGYRALYHPGMRIHHFVSQARMKAGYFRRRSFYQGVCDSFTDLRREHGLGPRAGVPVARKPPVVRTALWRVRNHVETGLKAAASYCRPSGRPYLDYLAVKREVAAGYRDGYGFHQREVRRDPALLRWVLRENFLGNEGIPHE